MKYILFFDDFMFQYLRRFLGYLYRKLYLIFVCLQKGFSPDLAILCDVKDIKSIPKSTKFYHPLGIVIREGTIIGENCIIRQNTTIGSRINENGRAMICNNVSIGANVLILGAIKIGDNVIIGAGSIVLKSVPNNTKVIGIYK